MADDTQNTFLPLRLIAVEELRRHSGWFIVLGIALVILGFIALGDSLFVTVVSVTLFGLILIVGAVIGIIEAFRVKKWSGFFLLIFLAALSGIVGLIIVANPVAGAVTLTLMMAVYFVVGGLFRIIFALVERFDSWGWMFFNGIVTLLLGILIWKHWPLSGLWIIGLFIGIEMIIYGWSWLMLGLSFRSPKKQTT
ncbi:MAG: HdeD family acid-resistance protein [Ignavibacteriales bacterium]|jgi:uncharacterized membrane protein HdeD (DUF308 family)